MSDRRFRLVLVPAGQVTEDGCKPGFVKLTGTPGEGDWEAWGPYPDVGEYAERDAVVLAGALKATSLVAAPPPSC